MGYRGRHYPFRPLERFFGDCYGQVIYGKMIRDDHIAAMSELTGFSRRTIHHWRKQGLTEYTADVAAVRVGAHPALIWPEWLDDGIADAD